MTGTRTENIWVQPLDGTPMRQLTQFNDDRTIVDFSWSPDGRKLAVTRASTLSDVVLLTRDRW
jgi:Tol biopolymer transport system component